MSAHPLDHSDQDAGKLVIQKKAAMIIMGSFTSGLYPKADYPDLALIPFPIIDPAYGTDSIDAPIDGVLASTTASINLPASEALMEFIGSTKFAGIIQAIAHRTCFKQACSTVPADPFIQSQVKLVQATKHVAQYFDRDSRPDFASPNLLFSAAKVLDWWRSKGDCFKSREGNGLLYLLPKQEKFNTSVDLRWRVFSPAEVPF